MLTVVIILITLAVTVVIICIYKISKYNKLLKRNNEVYNFKIQLIDLATTYSLRNPKKDDAFTWFFNKYTYDEMLYSKKPLTLEAWYTENEIKLIKS